ncbi:envelope glycoprotein B [Vespertilionid gammaherpesvirus 1]|uniref:Envelope glycoprotein B n=1 Tax=Vespertilionid gammaherpesvirus 1 TaxID=2560830 RepID=A0A0X9YAV2_9GAMA|nr:envelope glycoprotein B [Myotis gammaherpesvirus 8]AMA67368.1 envelope glycoprotein B [Vespertilionid gammaherpesvirus 1]
MFVLCAYLLLAALLRPIITEETTATPSPPTTPTVELDDPSPSLNPSRAFKDFLPFRVCSATSTGEIFRFPLEEKCPDTEDKTHSEGIALIYKTNIIPHIFKIRKYKKLVTSTTVYRGWFANTNAITNQFTNSYPIPLYEARHIDSTYQCFSAISVNENGNINFYADRDGYNETVFLQPIDGLTSSIRRYASQTEIYATPGAFPGMYRTRTTVNCEVTEMIARSVKPFEFFVTAVGDTIEMSPFLNKNGSEPASINKYPVSLHLLHNYSIATYGMGASVSNPPAKTFFANLGDYSMSWVAVNEKESHCGLTFWKGFSNAIQTQHLKSYHFIANDITASFTTPLEQDNEFNDTHSCAWTEINEEIKKRTEALSGTHVPNGTVQFFKTTGGLYIAWQPLIQINLLKAHKEATSSQTQPSSNATVTPMALVRRKREAVGVSGTEGSSEESVAASQVQFAYDSLRNSINKVLEELSRAWCREQHRASMMWFELSKINPTSVMSAIYGKPVAARFLGDVLSVSDCVIVDQNSVYVQKGLRVPGENELCYTRPSVSFKFINGTDTFSGQMGSRNEILLSTSLVENCRANTEHYFQVGDQMFIYKDYVYVNSVNMSSIPTLNTIMTLNLSFIQNIDFQVIELYSKNEKRLSNVLDIETMFREYNYYTQRLSGLRKDLDNTLDNNRDNIIRLFGDIVQDLGSIGKVVVNIASGVFSLFGSIVSGIINFIKNPLGGMLTILLICGAIFLIYILTRRTSRMYEAPIKMIYPNIDKASKESNVKPIDDEQLKSILLAMHNFQQENLNRQATEEKNTKPSMTSSVTGIATKFLRKRNGYVKLPTSEPKETAV